MLLFESPREPASRPVNTIAEHAVGIAAGLACYLALDLTNSPSAPEGGLSVSYVIAGASAVAITTAVLTLLRLPHPPAGASPLIVALGILHTAPELLSMMGAVILITITGWALNKLALGSST